MRLHFGTLLGTGLAVLATACSAEPTLPPPADLVDGPAPVVITLPTGVVRAGQVLRITQTNTGTAALMYNHCNRKVDRAVDTGWDRLPPELRLCTADLHTLAPGASAEVWVDVPADAKPGNHRFALQFWRESTREVLEAVSPTFRVED
ncbi:MAG: hypothetical protein KF709_02970 [Gemmatimonadaceae bacterium]|nr:hypothetical protein [Gemmatimonadaceae bacterium]